MGGLASRVSGHVVAAAMRAVGFEAMEVIDETHHVIERKDGALDGPGRIGWVDMSRTSRSYIYQGRRFRKTRSGFKHNCFEEETGAEYWISGPKKRGGDKLYGGIVEIDDGARVEYWTKIRCRPGAVHLKQTK